MPNRPRFSRFRRLPGLYRTGEKRPPDSNEELRLLSLYLPGRVLDAAEALAMKMGAATVQQYCEKLLAKAVESEEKADRTAAAEVRDGPMKSLDVLANDPDYLAEWSASAREHRESSGGRGVLTSIAPGPSPDQAPSARDVVLRHAALAGDDPTGLLGALRRGEPPGQEGARELVQALIDLEGQLREAQRLDRRLAYGLHRLAFEGQVLLTDGPARHLSSSDPGTVDLLRLVQEAVDRVLSGEDIRYYSDRSGPGDDL